MLFESNDQFVSRIRVVGTVHYNHRFTVQYLQSARPSELMQAQSNIAVGYLPAHLSQLHDSCYRGSRVDNLVFSQ